MRVKIIATPSHLFFPLRIQDYRCSPLVGFSSFVHRITQHQQSDIVNSVPL
nr:hypothetical protein [Citrobacter portucalensis]